MSSAAQAWATGRLRGKQHQGHLGRLVGVGVCEGLRQYWGQATLGLACSAGWSQNGCGTQQGLRGHAVLGPPWQAAGPEGGIGHGDSWGQAVGIALVDQLGL